MLVKVFLALALVEEPRGTVHVRLQPPQVAKVQQAAVAVDRMEEGKPSPMFGWQLLPSQRFSLELPPGTYQVRCAAAGFVGKASAPFTVAAGQTVSVECPLAEAAWVAGVVLAKKGGKPVDGAWVGPPSFLPGRCQRLGSEALPCELVAQAAVGKTDRYGSFRLALPPDGEQLLVALAEGFGPGWATVLPSAGAAPVVLELPPGGSIEASIATDEPGGAEQGCASLKAIFPRRDAARGETEALAALWQQQPEASGSVLWPAVYPGVWWVGWSARPCGGGEAAPEPEVSALVAVASGERRRVALEARFREVELQLAGLEAPALAGAKGSLSWDCQGGSGFAALGTVQPDGTVAGRARLPVGRCRVSVALETAGEAPWSVEVLTEEVVIVPRGKNAIERELALAELAGTVLGPSGSPVHAKVLVENELYRCTGSFQPGLNLLCPALPKGRYRVLAYADGAAARRQLVAVPGEGLELLLEQGYPVEGRVLGRRGEPLPGAWVRFASLEMADHGFPLGPPGVRSDAEGRFAFPGLPAGEGVLIVKAKEQGAVRFLDPKGVERSVEVQLEPLGGVWVPPLPEKHCSMLAAETEEGRLPRVALALLSGVLTASPRHPSLVWFPRGRYRLLCADEEGKAQQRTGWFFVGEEELVALPRWQPLQ